MLYATEIWPKFDSDFYEALERTGRTKVRPSKYKHKVHNGTLCFTFSIEQHETKNLSSVSGCLSVLGEKYAVNKIN